MEESDLTLRYVGIEANTRMSVLSLSHLTYGDELGDVTTVLVKTGDRYEVVLRLENGDVKVAIEIVRAE